MQRDLAVCSFSKNEVVIGVIYIIMKRMCDFTDLVSIQKVTEPQQSRGWK